MQIIQKPSEIEIIGLNDFNPVKIFECGQCFRWNREASDSYIGVAGDSYVGVESVSYIGVAWGRAARVRREGGSIFISGTMDDFNAVWRDYFDLDRDYAAIRAALCIDPYMHESTCYGAGIRILKQDRWEALGSFILSQCNNIPRIKQIVEKFSALYGEPVEFEGRTYYAFPTAERTAALTEEDLAPIRCGYRAPALIEAARAVAGGRADLDAMARLTPEDAAAALKQLYRVGDKVARCVMLFGLNMLDAFPVDTWIKKTLDAHYPQGLDPAVFHPHAGIAQQYMFYHARSTGK